jgi:hypothetical protein
MRYILCSLLLASSLCAQQQYQTASDSAKSKGSFYVDGIIYQYAAGSEYTVVAAVHSVMNHKYAAVKVRVYNTGQHSVTVRPEDILVEDAVAGRAVTPIAGAELAKRMRKPYNMARMAVSSNQDADATSSDGNSGSNQQLVEMMRAIASRSNQPSVPAGNNLLYTDTPGALETGEAPHHAAACDEVCRLRMGEAAQGTDILAQLQRQNTPEYIEQCSLRSNTVPPHASVGGVLYFPLGKLAQESSQSEHVKKRRILRVTVPVDDVSFQFVLLVE